MANEKYSNNRNQWRKSYPIGLPKRPPNLVSLSKIGADGVIYNSVIDLNQTIRHRDPYRVLGDVGSLANIGEYDEGLISFSNETFKAFSFNFTFTSAPTVVYSVNAGTDPTTGNINIYGLGKTAMGAVVGLSAPFTGTIRYRAVYSLAYPQYFLGVAASVAPTAGAFKASANVVIPNNLSYVTASWDALTTPPIATFASPYDDHGNYDANVSLSAKAGTVTSSEIVYEISAPISSSIYVLAIE